jgi:hypothetical protein
MGEGEGAQTMYTHTSKCKNDKIKGIKKKNPPQGKSAPLYLRYYTKLFTPPPCVST